MAETAEKFDKPKETANPGHSALAYTNHDMATAQSAGRHTENPNVVEGGQVKFTDIYGPQGVNKDLATPLAVAQFKENNLPTDAKPAVVAPVVDKTGAVTDNAAPINPADVQVQKTRLEHLTQGMTTDQAAEVQKDMKAIENRKPPLTADQVNKIYDSTSKLLENPNNSSPLSADERNQLAGSILHNASLRTGLDQGFHNTCNVTTLERRLNITNPAEAARIVSEVGLTGEYKSLKDGKMIKLDAASLSEDRESKLAFGDARTDGKRDYASQIFDQATINDYWQHQKPPLYYSQRAPEGQSDTGERLRFANHQEVPGPDGKPMRQPALSTDAMAEIGKSLGFTGQYIISNAEVGGPNNTDGSSKVHNYQEFSDALTSGKPPAIIMVNANDKLFGGTGDNGGSGGWHVVNVSDYQAGPPAKIFMTNQWGSENNKWVNVSDLYNATLPSNAGRVDQNGQGGSDRGQGQGGSDRGQDQGGKGGWSRNDGVMRDEDYRKWRQDLFDKSWKNSDENPLKKNPQLDPQAQIEPLQAMLKEAQNKNESFQVEIIQKQIQDIMATTGR